MTSVRFRVHFDASDSTWYVYDAQCQRNTATEIGNRAAAVAEAALREAIWRMSCWKRPRQATPTPGRVGTRPTPQ
jgi:hypothetical protein